MRRVWKRTLLVAAAVLGVASIALNVWFVRDALSPRHGTWLELWEPKDSFDQESDLGQLTAVGSIVAFAGHGELAPQWMRCNGQTLTRAEFPELYDALESSLKAPGAPAVPVPGAVYRLPDSRNLCGIDWPRALRTAEPHGGLRDRLLWTLLKNAPKQIQSLILLPDQATLDPESKTNVLEPFTLAVRVR